MNKAVKTIVLGSLSLTLLTGCIEDNYDYGSGGGGGGGTNPPATTAIFNLYGNNSDQRFQLMVEDSDGNVSPVAHSGDVSSFNITTAPVDPSENEGAVLVAITDNKPASIMTASSTAVDLSVPSADGTVQFYLKPKAQTLADKKMFVKLTAQNGEQVPVDITSAYNAFVGAQGTQQVKLPLSCFTDKDFSKSSKPFNLKSESDAEFELSSVRLRASTLEEAYVLECASESEVLDDEVSVIYKRERIDNKWEEAGWSNNRGAWGGAVASTTSPANGSGIIVTFPPEQLGGQNGGATFSISADDSAKDLSRYMEQGVLRFNLRVDDYADHPTRVMTVKMDTTDTKAYGASMTINLDEDYLQEVDGAVEIPVKDLFSRGNAVKRVDVRTLQNIESGLVIQPAVVEGNDTLANMSFHINDIELVLDPSLSPEPDQNKL